MPGLEKKVCVIGLGYVGLPTAALLASKGFSVLGVDVNQEVVETIHRGDIHILEAGLSEMVASAVSSGNLRAALIPAPSDIFIIAVPTPLKDDYIPNIDYVLSATRAIAPHLKPGDLVIVESTSPVGTMERVARELADLGINLSTIDIAYCPERILPGAILSELVNNSRLIGGLSGRATGKARDFYAAFVSGELILTNARTAEMTKLVENAYRNVNIAFANELSMICDEAEINAWEVIEYANRHPRVQVHTPGPGVGGHCIAIDPLFISHQARDEAKLISAAHHRNTEKTQWVVEKIRHAAYKFAREHHRAPTIACFGLSYKPNSDDIRESPALAIVRDLLSEQYTVMAVDPLVSRQLEFKRVLLSEALEKADILVFLVAHDLFRSIPSNMTVPILDFCGLTHRPYAQEVRKPLAPLGVRSTDEITLKR